MFVKRAVRRSVNVNPALSRLIALSEDLECRCLLFAFTPELRAWPSLSRFVSIPLQSSKRSQSSSSEGKWQAAIAEAMADRESRESGGKRQASRSRAQDVRSFKVR